MKTQKQVLIIEDDAELLSVYSEVLKQEGFSVVTAQTANLGKQFVKSKPVDLIILDLLLPDQSGLEFLEELRGEPKFSKIPVIVLTVLPEEAAFKKAESLGIHGYLTKSDITPDILVRRVQLALAEK